MRISDWSSDVCSSDLARPRRGLAARSRRHRCGQRRSDRAAAGVGGRAGRAVIIPRQARAGVDGDEVTEQPIKALPFKGRVGWGWVSPPHKHQQREGQAPWKARATHGSGKNNANENFDATRLTPNANYEIGKAHV